MTRSLLLFCSTLLGVCLVAPPSSLAQHNQTSTDQPDEVVTDRPDATERSSTVPAGRLQLEAGLQYTFEDVVEHAAPLGHRGKHDAHQFSAPNMLLRLGVADFAELRLRLPDLTYENVTGSGDDLSLDTVSLGTKLAAALTERWRVGLLAFGDLDIETSDIGGGVIATTDVDLSSRLTFALNAGVTSEVDLLDERQWDGLVSAALDFALTRRVGAFLETFVIIPEGNLDWFVNAGPTYLLTDHLQLDAFLGVQVPNADQIFLGSGVSVLF